MVIWLAINSALRVGALRVGAFVVSLLQAGTLMESALMMGTLISAHIMSVLMVSTLKTGAHMLACTWGSHDGRPSGRIPFGDSARLMYIRGVVYVLALFV